MGTGKIMKCKSCGHSWHVLKGVGFNGKPQQQQSTKECPKCHSKDIEEAKGISILWD